MASHPLPIPSAPPLSSSSSSSSDDEDENLNIASEDTLVLLSGSILHLIDSHYSLELASGHLSILRLHQGPSTLAILLRVGPLNSPSVQFPLTLDTLAVKLDNSHYFFSISTPHDILNYGLTLAPDGQEDVLKRFDKVLSSFSNFAEQLVCSKEHKKLMMSVESVGKITPAEVMRMGSRKEIMEKTSAVYWTTLAPNVEDYSGRAAKMIAAGSGQVVKGILWCGDVAVDRIKWGDEVLRRKMGSKAETEVSEETLKRIKRVKSITKMSEKVATGILSGVVKVTGFFTSSIANSKAGKKFISLLPEEVVLASLEGFGKICDAVEVSGSNVLTTSSTVTTGLVQHRYGEQAAEATNEGLGAAGHAIGAAWALFKIRKAFDPKSVIKPTNIAKSTAKFAAEYKSKQKK